MKVEVKLDIKYEKPYVLIHTNKVDQSISEIITFIESKKRSIIAYLDEKAYILETSDIYLIQVVEGKLLIYDKQKKYVLNKRLYEVKQLLNQQFIQISKGSIVNMSHIESVEASFSGSLKIKLKNGLNDYIARTYVKAFKNYLGL